MKKIVSLLVAVAALFMAEFASAQSRTSYFMEGSYFRTDMNPALAPTRGFVALPGMSGVGIDVPNNFLSVDNFIYQKGGDMVTALHRDVTSQEFLGKLPDVGRLGVNANVNILGFGFYAKRTYWNFGTRVRSTTDITMSKELFSALKTLGNGTYDLGNTAINSNTYLETYLGTSFPIGKHVNLGIRAKFLVGILNLHTEFDKVAANVGVDGVSAQLRGKLVGNSIFIDQSRVVPGSTIDGNITDMIVYNDAKFLFKNAKSYGAAIDLGAEIKMLKDHLKLSFAVNDVGFIKWKAKTNYSANASADFAFNGFSVNEHKLDMEAGYELLNEKPSTKDYITRLNGSLNVGLEYNFLRNHFAIGVLSHTELYGKRIYSELTASLNIRATNWLSATVSHTFLMNNKLGVFGAAINIHPRALNIFIGADFIDTQYGMYKNIPVPRYQNSINVYAGVGFNFARPKFMREEARAAKEARRLARKAN